MYRVAIVLLAATLFGCNSTSGSSTSPLPLLTVEEALRRPPSTETVAVDGYVVANPDGSVRLCTGLSGSYPPQCGRPALTVNGLDLADLDKAEQASGVTWTRATLNGVVSGDVLTVAAKSPAS